MNLTIVRRIKFCAGHRLLGHGGKCEFLHGHNYVAEVHVLGRQVDAVGRVMDFADLKRLIKGWIDEHWDHSFLLHEADQNAIAALEQVRPARYFLLPYNPTAENMARYLLQHVCPPLLEEYGVRASRVVIWETDDACAEATVAGEQTGSAACEAARWEYR